MKKRALSILLACVFLLSVFMFCTTAFAAENSADGLTAVLDTDKDAYVAGDTIDVTLEVTNTGNLAHNVQTELIIPEGVTLVEGQLKSEAAPLAGNESVKFGYVLEVPSVEVPTTAAPTTQAPTTQPGTGDDTAPETRDLAAVIYGTLAIASLAGLIALTFGSKMLKQRWFVLILCGALLLGVAAPMAASAAEAGNSFEVVKAITIDGTDAEVKAIVTYDLVTEDVAFKQDGVYLWAKDVEQGYYLPSDVTYDGQTTSKNGTYRPEVNAPYIDMLFGAGSKAGEFTTDIFNAEAEQTALIGLTDDPASKAALELIDEDEWIITVIDGKLVVTGWYDNATAAAARALYELAAVDAADVTLSLPMIGKMDYVDVDLPAVTFGNFVGGMDSDFGAVVLRWNEVVADDFDTYCDALAAAGYELYESNTMDGFKQTKTLEFATYVKGDDAVLVQYLPVSLLDQDYDTLTAAEKKAYEAAFSADGDAIRLVLTSADLLGNNDAANEGWTDAGIAPKVHLVNLYNKQGDGNDIGQCQIFTLADGSFIVVDGGQSADAEQVYRTLHYMNEREDGKIVVAAWFLTHAHGDHSGALGTLAASEWASEITIEQVVLNHVAKSYRWRTEYAPYGYGAGFSAEFDNVKSVISKFAQGEDFRMVMPHMGQIMKIRNAEIEIITVGDEDMFPVIFNNDNGQSMVFRVTFPGVTVEDADQTILILGDSALDQTYNVYFPLLCGELHADILQVAHHGLGGQTSRFYPMFTDVDVAVWPTTWRTVNAHGFFTNSTNGGLRQFNPLDIVCDEYVHTLELPFDKENDQVLRTKIGTYKTKFQDGEMTLASLGVGRFGKDILKYLDATVDYLLGESADADVLVLNSVTYLQDDGVNVVETLAEAMDYPYYYYAPAWNQSAGSDMSASNDGTYGNLILSRYPILSAENLVYHEGTTADSSNEGRSAGHVVLDVETKLVDVYFTEVTGAGNWEEIAKVFKPENDIWFIMGVGKNSVSGIQTALGDTTVHAAVADHTRENIYSNGQVTFTASSKQSVNAATGCVNMDALITATAQFSLYTAPEASDAPVRQAFVNWWVNSWGNNFTDFQKVVKTLKDVNPAVAAFHMVNHEAIGMTEEQVKAELGYPYAIWVPNSANSDGKWSGHYLVSHYPIEDLGVLEVSNGSDDAADQYKQRRAFGHALVTINGTEIDIWYGSVGPNAPKQVAKLEATVNATATETGRPFIVSTNDAGSLVGLTSFAGYEVYNYNTSYMANVLVSKGKVTVTGTELVDSGVTWAGVDKMNVLDLDVEQAPSFLNWWCHSWGGSFNGFETVVENLKAQNVPIVAMHQISNSTIGIENPELVLKEAGYEYGHYVHVLTTSAGKTIGHFLMSHYPIEVQDDFIISDGSDDAYKENRAAGHVIVDVNGTKVDVWYGNIDGSAAQLAKVEAEINRVAVESGRPFIFSSNDITSLKGITSFAGYSVTNYYTDYISNVLISSGLNVTGTETVKTSISYPTMAGVDDMNIIRFETADGGLQPGDPFVPPVEPEEPPVVEPEEPEGTPVTLKVAQWWCNYVNKTEVRAEVAAYLKEASYDMVGLIHLPSDAFTDIAALAKECGYEYYAYAMADETVKNFGKCGHLILSKYPIESSATVTILADDGTEEPATEGRALVYAVVDVEGVKIDVFCGENAGGGASDEQRALMESLIKEKVDASGNDFVVFGYHYRGFSEYAGKKVTQYHTGNTILASEGLELTNGKEIAKADIGTGVAGTPNMDPMLNADLIVTLPEEEEPAATETVSFIEWWGVGFSKTTEATVAWLADPANHVDIAALVHSVNYTAEQAAALAEAAGYAYHYWLPSEADGSRGPMGHLLLSDYPITWNDTLVLVEDAAGTASPEGRTFAYVTVDVNGTPFDVFFGENNSGASGSAQNQETVEPWVNAHVAAAGNAYVVTGYNFSRQDYPAFTADNYTIVTNSSGSILAPASVTMANQGTKTAGLGGDEPVYADLTFAAAEKAPKEVSLKLMSWGIGRMNGNDTYPDQAARWAELLKVIVAEDADIVHLHCVNGEAQRDMILADLAAAYPYSVYVSGSANNSQMLLSKYPITSTDTAQISTGENEIRVAGHSIVDVDGTPVEIYFAHLNSADRVNEATAMVTAFGLPTNDAWFVMGAFHGMDISSAMGEAVNSAVSGAYTIYAPADTVTMTGSKNTTCEYNPANPAFHADACILAQVTFTAK